MAIEVPEPLRLSDDYVVVPLVQRTIERAGNERSSAGVEIRALVDATVEVIANTGSFDPHVRDILDCAKLSRQVLYRHFKSKDELLLVVLDESWRGVAAYLRTSIASSNEVSARLRDWIQDILYQARDPEASRIRPFAITGRRLEARFPKEFAEARRTFVALLVEIIAGGVRDGVFESRDPEGDALAIHDAVFLRQSRHLVLGTYPSREAVDDLHDFALRALRPSTFG